MKYYVKVTKEVARQVMGDDVPLTLTNDGNCVLYQSEVNGVEGMTLSERVRTLGGSLIQECDVLAEIKGTVETPADCYTPKRYGGTEDDRGTGKSQTSSDVSNAVVSSPATGVPVEGVGDSMPTGEEADNESDSDKEEETKKKAR